MSMAEEITPLLREWRRGDAAAGDRIVARLYPQLKAIARKALAAEGRISLQPTELVNELYLRLRESRQPEWDDRTHFLGIAARLIRQVLVDLARRRRSLKRGAGHRLVEVTGTDDFAFEPQVDVLALDLALDRLAFIDSDAARCVELRFFGGLEIAETAALLETSASTVVRKWRFARAWLRREIGAGCPPHELSARS